MYEVELKAKIADMNALRKELVGKDLKLKSEIIQKDHIYGFEGDFPPKDGGVIARIREVDNHKVLEIKEIDREHGGIEIPHEIKEIEPYHKLLLKLGFKKFFVVKKKRTKYSVQGLTLCLDSVEGLGDFIEVEKIVKKESEKKKAKEECLEFLESLKTAYELTNQKYGDIMCEKLGIKNN